MKKIISFILVTSIISSGFYINPAFGRETNKKEELEREMEDLCVTYIIAHEKSIEYNFNQELYQDELNKMEKYKETFINLSKNYILKYGSEQYDKFEKNAIKYVCSLESWYSKGNVYTTRRVGILATVFMANVGKSAYELIEKEENSKRASQGRNECYRAGLKLLNEKRYTEALKMFDNAINLDSEIIGQQPTNPTDGELNNIREDTIIKVRNERSQQAVAERKKYYLKGCKLADAGNYLEAIEQFDKAIRLSSDIIEASTEPTDNEINNEKAKALEEYEFSQKEKGLVKYEGNWVTPKEKKKMEKQKKKEEKERKKLKNKKLF